MRHETCLSCLHPESSYAHVLPGIIIAEAVGPGVHHHHRMLCVNCGAWWFDDITQRPGLDRILEVDLRDTRWCDCPEDREFYRRTLTLVMESESECRCDRALVDSLPSVHLN